MASHESGVGTVVKWGILGVAAYWIYTTFFSGSIKLPALGTEAYGDWPATSSTSSSSTSTTTPSTPSAPSTPAYSGPSLDQMYANLQASVQAAYGSNPALSCGTTTGTGVSGFGGFGATPSRMLQPVGGSSSRSLQPVGTTSPSRLRSVNTQPVIVGTMIPSSGGTQTPPANCPTGSIQATYDDFNWYLLQANPSISAPPNAPDHTSQITLNQYWQWAAPLLKQQIPGLSGLGRYGLGAIWGAM
jgi:hypothetical protein